MFVGSIFSVFSQGVVNKVNPVKLKLGVLYNHSLTSRITNPQISDNPNQDYGSSLARNYGFLLGIDFTKRIALKVEMHLSNIRQEYSGVETFSQDVKDAFSSASKITTFDIPVMLEVGKILYVEGGPVFSFMLDADFEQTYDNLFNSQTFKTDVKETFENYDIGLALGSGINIPIKMVEIKIGLRYTTIFKGVSGVDAIGVEVIENNTATHVVAIHTGFNILF